MVICLELLLSKLNNVISGLLRPFGSGVSYVLPNQDVHYSPKLLWYEGNWIRIQAYMRIHKVSKFIQDLLRCNMLKIIEITSIKDCITNLKIQM